MFETGNLISFFDTDETFEHINLELIDDFINHCSWYQVISSNDEGVTVRSESGLREIDVSYEEYQMHTKESLRNHLTQLLTFNEANKKYADVCKKIKQLYRKHNESGSHFKFQGV